MTILKLSLVEHWIAWKDYFPRGFAFGYLLKTSQELQLLSLVTLYWRLTINVKIVAPNECLNYGQKSLGKIFSKECFCQRGFVASPLAQGRTDKEWFVGFPPENLTQMTTFAFNNHLWPKNCARPSFARFFDESVAPQIYIFHIYTGPKFTKPTFTQNPDLHKLKSTQLRFTHT